MLPTPCCILIGKSKLEGLGGRGRRRVVGREGERERERERERDVETSYIIYIYFIPLQLRLSAYFGAT